MKVRHLVALVLLAVLAAGSGAAPGQPAAGQRSSARFLAWWQHETVCAELGIAPELRRELAAALDNMQTSYQLAQTRLTDARARQTAMLVDPAFSREQLVAFNRSEVVAASEKMQALNFEARLLVRGKLAAAQLAKIVAAHPRFFTARWFKVSQLPVLEGKVVVDDE